MHILLNLFSTYGEMAFAAKGVISIEINRQTMEIFHIAYHKNLNCVQQLFQWLHLCVA